MTTKVAVKKSKYVNIYLLLGVGIILISLFNTLQVSGFNSDITGKIAQATEQARPAEVQLITLTTSSCSDCFDISSTVGDIEDIGVNITSRDSFDYSSSEGAKFISDYSIEKLPSIIITGEINKSSKLKSKLGNNAKEVNGALVFSNPLPPYIDSSSGKVRGEVSVISINNNECTQCASLNSLVTQLSSSGVKFVSNKVLSFDSSEAKSLVSKYNISILPAVILSSEASVYNSFESTWLQIGSKESDNYFVTRSKIPPFYDVNSKRVVGLVNMTIISCNSGCYDAESIHLPILRNYGVALGDVITYNYSTTQAKLLIAKYNITKIPAFILTGDVDLYSALIQVWSSVGTIEGDGAYIFREAQVVSSSGTDYKDLTNITQ